MDVKINYDDFTNETDPEKGNDNIPEHENKEESIQEKPKKSGCVVTLAIFSIIGGALNTILGLVAWVLKEKLLAIMGPVLGWSEDIIKYGSAGLNTISDHEWAKDTVVEDIGGTASEYGNEVNAISSEVLSQIEWVDYTITIYFICSLISMVGAILLLKMKMTGFFMYVASNLMIVLFLFVGGYYAWMPVLFYIIVSFAFIALYSAFFRKLVRR